MTTKFIKVVTLLLLINCSSSGQFQNSILRQKIKLLQPFEGSWTAEVKLHARNGTIIEETGIYKISWVLDGTYLQWHAFLRDKKDTNKIRNFIIMTTYNPDSVRYENLYLYRASPMKVFETGVYDAESREYKTAAFIPLEDGFRDEYVRTITRIVSDSNRISYIHYSRYKDEKEEILDFEANLTRIK